MASAPNGNSEMISRNSGASAGQLASIASSVPATWAGRMLREIPESATATLLRWFGHLFARLRKRPPFAPGQAPKSAPRNFFQHWIDLLGDEFIQRHLPAALALEPATLHGALHKRGPAEPKKMRVEPTSSTTAEISAMADHAFSIEHDQREADREKSGSEILRLQFYRHHEKERL